MARRVALLLVLIAVAAAGIWAFTRYKAARHSLSESSPNDLATADGDAWTKAIEKVKEDRGEAAGQGGIEIPPELRHYSDRHWFLATQVAEVTKQKVQTCQDFVDLAGMIQRGEMVAVPAVTDSYVLFGVGAQADGDVFSKYENEENIELYPEAQLNDVYKRVNEQQSAIQAQIRELNNQFGALKKKDREKRSELQKQITARQQDLQAVEKDKSVLDEVYSNAQSRQKLLRDYEFIHTFASNFRGRSYNIDDSSDRQALKVSMLRSLRPPALKIMAEVASAYHQQFDRPLPVSSLVRPEQYQRALRRVNRNAVLIDIPPHSTGLAFDIDYRYMSAREQSFVMAELARLEKEGRIEVIRESNANYHVFAFVNGTRPSDDMIRASLDEAGAPVEAAHHSGAKASKAKVKSKPKVKSRRPTKSTPRKRRR
ncbi:MAG TPA: DUF5715 family protein [Pyrinomonadaceae bacterium]|nr:DUF5715 family protein [Pyrinomonadaceae bacterium]